MQFVQQLLIFMSLPLSARMSFLGYGDDEDDKAKHPVVVPSSALISPAWTWGNLEVGGDTPAGRQGHAMVAIGEKLYVIGGCVQEIQCYGDIHVLDTTSMLWTELGVTGDVMDARGGHSATLVDQGIVVFAGANSETMFGDVMYLHVEQLEWSLVDTRATHGPPSQRTSHAAAADAHGNLYMHGGSDADGAFLSDLWLLSGSLTGGPAGAVWTELQPSGFLLGPRVGHSFTFVDDALVLFGGYTADGSCTNEAYTLDTAKPAWVALDDAPMKKSLGELAAPIDHAPRPPPRQAHIALRHGRQLVIVGGCDPGNDGGPVCFGDVWTLSISTSKWSRQWPAFVDSSNYMQADGTQNAFPEGFSAAFVHGSLISFGGCAEGGAGCSNDVATIDTHDPCPDQCGDHGTCVDEQFCKCDAGFTGHDCMRPVLCAVDCGTHGGCSDNSTCVCDSGWSGVTCSAQVTEQTQESLQEAEVKAFKAPGLSPSNIFGKIIENEIASGKSHSTVTAGPGTGLLPQGYTNKVAHVNLGAAKAQKAKAAQQISPFGKSHTENRDIAPPDKKHFGISDLNKNGRMGVVKSQCTDNCNFAGVCGDEGTCYCQPGFTGKTCAHKQVPKDFTVSGKDTSIACGIAFVVSMTLATAVISIRSFLFRGKEQVIYSV